MLGVVLVLAIRGKGVGCHQEAGKENAGSEISKLARNLQHLQNLQH